MARFVSLQQLVDEGHAESPSAMLLAAVDRGLALGLTGGGILGVRVSAADKLRQERREHEARVARQAELAREAAQDAKVEALVARQREAEFRDRQRSLEAEVGPLFAIADAWRKAAATRPDVYLTVEQQAELAAREPSLEELEDFAREEFGYGLDPVS